jgi:molybdenum cofactor cytidylyltransferase
MKPFIVGICLAAGKSSRMGACKLAQEVSPGWTVGGLAVMAAIRSSLDRLIVVTREEQVPAWYPREHLDDLPADRLRTVFCSEADRGMAYSLHCGLRAAQLCRPDAVVILLGDQPLVTADMIDGLIGAYASDRKLDYAACGYRDQAQVPALFARWLWPALFALEGDTGARSLCARPGLCGKVIRESEENLFLDADTYEDLERIKSIFQERVR